MSRAPAYPIKKLIALSEEQADRISDYRFGERIASESDAIRRLIEIALDAEDAKRARIASDNLAIKKLMELGFGDEEPKKPDDTS